MANLYTPFTNGTFESGFSGLILATVGDTSLSGNSGHALQLYYPPATEPAFEGTRSGRIRCTHEELGHNNHAKWKQTIPFRDTPAASNARSIALTAGAKYKMKAKVRTPSADPGGVGAWSALGDNAIIGLGQGQTIISADPFAPTTVWNDLGGGKYRVTHPSDPDLEYIVSKASGCRDAWTEISITFRETSAAAQASGNSPYWVPFFLLFSKGTQGSSALIPIAAEATGDTGFIVWIDQIELDEIEVCDLAFGSPAYTKTNETAENADDGTITINATSSYTREYSLNNVDWQLSNVFSDLAPGSYTIYVRDTNPLGCNISQAGVQILEWSPPPCNLFWGSPSFVRTNETFEDANDGTITVTATSSYPKEFAIRNEVTGLPDPLVWQSSPVFTGLAPGLYAIYGRDSNPTGCAIELHGIIINAGEGGPPPEPPPPDTPILTVQANPLNKNNLIPWFEGIGQIGFTEMSSGNCCWDIPAAYRARTRGKNNLKHAFIAVNGEEFTFYINFDTPINLPNFDGWKLALVTEAGLVPGFDNIAPLQKHLYPDGVSYNVYASVILNAVPINKYYKLVIYNSVNDILFVSGLMEVLAISDAQCLSTRLRYRASINLYNFNYETLPDYANIHRVRLYRVDEQDEATITQYRAVSSGQLRNVHYDADRYVVLEAYYFDDNAHRALGVFQLHDSIFLNDIGYLVKSPYKRQFDREKELYKGLLEMYEQAFSTKNRYNRLGGEAVITNSDFILGDDGSRLRY